MLRGGAARALIIIGVLLMNVFALIKPVNAATRVEVNIFYPGAAYNTSLITNFQSSLGVDFTSAKWYQDWATGFDAEVANRFNAAGLIPELTWEPQANEQGISYDAVIQGNYDNYITTTANQIKSLGFPIRISLAPEMNTDWTPWGIGKVGNNRENHKLFWRHVVQKFRDAGVTNVKWVWAANVRPWNAQELYGTYADIFPGSDYVDYMGLDGYNWGTSQPWSVWETFDQIFLSSYNELAGVSNQDILIMEMASTEQGGNKATWITNMFERLRDAYPRIKGITWFHMQKETDWRIDSSPASAAAFSAMIAGTTNTSSSSSGNSGGSTTSSAPKKKQTPPPSSKPNPTVNFTLSIEEPKPAAETLIATTLPPITPKLYGDAFERNTTPTVSLPHLLAGLCSVSILFALLIVTKRKLWPVHR